MYIPTSSSSSFTRLPAREQKAVCRKWNGRSISHPAGLGGRNSFVCSTEGARNDRLSRSSNIGRPIELIEPKRVKKTKQNKKVDGTLIRFCLVRSQSDTRGTSDISREIVRWPYNMFLLDSQSSPVLFFFANTTKSLSSLTLSKAWKWLIPSHAIILVRRWSEWDPIWILSLVTLNQLCHRPDNLSTVITGHSFSWLLQRWYYTNRQCLPGIWLHICKPS